MLSNEFSVLSLHWVSKGLVIHFTVFFLCFWLNKLQALKKCGTLTDMISRSVCSICIFTSNILVRHIPEHNLLLSFGNRTHVWSWTHDKAQITKVFSLYNLNNPWSMFHGLCIIKFPIFEEHDALNFVSDMVIFQPQ